MKALFSFFSLAVSVLHAAAPLTWTSRGIGAGGGMFSPAISPHDPNVMFLAVDMSHVFRTTDGGLTWVTVDFDQLGGKQLTEVQFTSTPTTLYSQDLRFAADETALSRPVKSTDLGDTWSLFSNWPTTGGPMPAPLRAGTVHANPQRDDTFLSCVGTTSGTGATGKIYFYQSAGLGGGFTVAYSFSANQGRVAGVFWDGGNVWAATNDGLLYSNNGGQTFSSAGATGLTGTLLSFAAAKDAGTGLVRFYAVSTSGSVGAQSFPQSYGGAANKVWRLDWSGVGASVWTDVSGAIAATGVDHPTIVAMARNDVNLVHAASSKSGSYPNNCTVWRLANAGGAWQSIFTIPGNANIATGWGGINNRAASGSRQFETAISYAAPCGLAVAPTQSSRVIFCDNAVIHLSASADAPAPRWSQVYCAADNPGHGAGQLFQWGQSYLGNGLECTVWTQLDWASPTHMLAACLDIKCPLSVDGGTRWGFPYDHSTLAGGDVNSVTHDPQTSVCYAAAGNTVTAYEYLGCDDAHTDIGVFNGPAQGVYYQSLGETAWHALKTDFGVAAGQAGATPVWLTFDDSHRKLYTSVVSSSAAKDGIYALDLATGQWSKLPAPTRVVGGGTVTVQHPFNVRVLPDGALVASYCAHQVGDATVSPPTLTNGASKPTSGVYYLAAGSGVWQDRTKNEMRYFTRDVIVDPHDPTGQTWFACVWNAGNVVTPAAPGDTPSSWGGLYRTFDGGLNWTRIWHGDSAFSGSATSCTIHPEFNLGGEMLLTTRFGGLWITGDCRAANPVFTRVDSYRFRAPERAYYDPHHRDRIWITSAGNGLVSGTRPTSFSEWQQRKFGAQSGDGNISGRTVDPDFDGNNNTLEYALAGEPQTPQAALCGVPQFGSGAVPTLSFRRNLAAADTTWTIEASGDLIGWQPVAQAQGMGAWSALAGGSISETSDGAVLYTDDVVPAGGGRRFLRVRVDVL